MPSTKRLIELEITQREIEALTEMVYPGIIKKASPNSKAIAQRALHKISETYYQKRQSRLKLQKLDDFEINEDIENDDDFDAISNIPFSLRIFEVFSLIEDNDFTPEVELNVMDTFTNERVKPYFNAQNILCIMPATKGREKLIYQFELLNGKRILKSYLINDDLMTFNYLIEKLDKINRYLLQVGKGAIINIKYYNLMNNRTIQLQLKNISDKKINQIKLTKTRDE